MISVTTQTIEATGEHSLVYVPAKAATADQDGNTEYWRCEVCGLYFSDEAGTRRVTPGSVRIPATGGESSGGSGDCPYCGKSHNDHLYGWIIYLLHVIVYYLLLLGQMFR